VSNRLPVSIRKAESGWELQASTGGLASGLSSLHTEFDTCWIGWPGRVARDHRKEVEERLISDFRCFPVFLSDSLVEKYYEGYSNRTIWPIFHSLTSHARYSAGEWEAYKKANHLFFLRIEEIYRPGDIIWVHDYQLMLLPRFLRERFPQATIGFFLHIPFPHSDIFRLLPQQKEILDDLVAVDLIGFHTHDYAQAFVGSVRRLLGYDNTLGQIMIGDRVVQSDVFPMGIDFTKYATAPSDPSIRNEIDVIQTTLQRRTVVFSVSRLDYTKGIPESLEAISEFLSRYPDWHGRLVYVLVVVPSRERVERYANLKREIDRLVGRINSAFGTVGWQPVRYIYRNLSFGELTGLYVSADVALITPLRDGMNLIAKEYLAVKGEGKGVLILSEFAGAAKELQEATIVNPNSREDVAEALHKALRMPDDEQRRRNSAMRQRLETHDIRHWVAQFLAR
ncbi:MAG: bifunctional alpha,alpha-trehalose-phosphate synthase (UDP-forming)/trehalose-phosphatase, partial [Bacteroidetes bacterium]|nr:bifunctional alpha,alpha-trehalose-phosphate synthase (UDP-forming)/trehalose-phosphatase [Bacteroidota bacterium]